MRIKLTLQMQTIYALFLPKSVCLCLNTGDWESITILCLENAYSFIIYELPCYLSAKGPFVLHITQVTS